MPEPPLYPGYDVLAKRETPSWNAKTREVIEQRLATPNAPRFFSAEEWLIADALCRRILPQTNDPDPVSLVALLDAKLLVDHGDGFRQRKHALFARCLATRPCRARWRGEGEA